jgi:thioredoxin 1
MKTFIMIAVAFLLSVQPACARGDSKAQSDASQALADRIVDSPTPVFVDFWAEWCMACRILEPTIEGLKKEFEGRVEFVRVDVDVHRGITSYFGVTAMPTVFVIEDKTVRSALQGVRSKDAYRAEINKALDLAKGRGSKKD